MKRKVLTVGTFDLYHEGHVNLFKACAKIASPYTPLSANDAAFSVVVGVNTGDFVKRYKGKYPIIHDQERYNLVASCKYVTEVIWNDNENLSSLLEKTKPNFLVIGSDWAKKDYYAQIGVTQEELEKKGVLLCYVPYTQGISTTLLKERILSG